MLHLDPRVHGDPHETLPQLDIFPALHERHRLARVVARGAESRSPQSARGYVARDAAKIDAVLEEVLQRLHVHESAQHRWGLAPSHQHVECPAPHRSADADRLYPVHLRRSEPLPLTPEIRHRLSEWTRMRRQRRGVDGARRHPSEDRDVQLRSALGDRLQHSCLVGGARAASREHQCESRFVRRGLAACGHGQEGRFARGRAPG